MDRRHEETVEATGKLQCENLAKQVIKALGDNPKHFTVRCDPVGGSTS